MCCFYMGIAQIASDPPPLSNGQTLKKSAPNHPGKPFHPPSPFWQYPYGYSTFQKRGFPQLVSKWVTMIWLSGKLAKTGLVQFLFFWEREDKPHLHQMLPGLTSCTCKITCDTKTRVQEQSLQCTRQKRPFSLIKRWGGGYPPLHLSPFHSCKIIFEGGRGGVHLGNANDKEMCQG